ncbi:MAG: sugar porter family MFS transporter [Bacteroidales bacterium]|nr:sugar porter family MFS transporter [Bacteroidales bacterium]
MKEKKSINWNLIVIAIIASTGGLLFGFDTGVISGALPFLKQSWALTTGQQEWITTAVLVGAFLGAIFGGRLTDILGRKKIIIYTSIIFAIASILCGISPSPAFLIVSRILIGVAIGISSIAVPLYISEISPAKIRGALVSSFQLMITIGILVSYFSDLAFADESNPFSWRWMFYVGVFPAIVLFVGMIFMPETPRWLLSKGRNEEGEKVLKKVENPSDFQDSLKKINEEIEKDKSAARFKDIFVATWKTPIFIAIGIMFVQQFVGINTVIYYAPTIFLLAGFSGAKAAIAATVSVGTINVLSTVVSMFLIDKLGRRKLYFIGLVGMCLSLVALGSFFFFKDTLGDSLKWATVASILIYIIFFALSLGPLGWLIISEIFPTKYRGVGVSIGSFSNWFFNAIVAFTFLKLAWLFTGEGMEITKEVIVDGIAKTETDPNPAGAFFIYAAVAIIGIIWGYKYIPETKGKTLEEIEEHWRQGRPANKL